MKRLIAISFLCVFLFNLFGYRLLITYLQYQEEYRLEVKKQMVSEKDLVSIKVAANLPPYTSPSSQYEVVSGEVNVAGMIYKYVKRKLMNDSIEFLCMPHIEKKRLENAREEFFRLSNDLQNASDHKKTTNTLQIKPIVFEYCSLTDSYNFLRYQDNLTIFYDIFTALKPLQFFEIVDHPPEQTIA